MAIEISFFKIEQAVINQFHGPVGQQSVSGGETATAAPPQIPRGIFSILLGCVLVVLKAAAFILDGGTGFFEALVASFGS